MEEKHYSSKEINIVGAESKANPWPVRVDIETRKIIRKAARLENKKLEDFFGTTIKPFCQSLISEAEKIGKQTELTKLNQKVNIPIKKRERYRKLFKLLGIDSSDN